MVQKLPAGQQETDGTFVALTFNLKTMKVVSTGISSNFKWFRIGEVVNINPQVQSSYNDYWCKYECNSTGKITTEKGSSSVAACHISYAKCYNSCVNHILNYASCKYLSHGPILELKR